MIVPAQSSTAPEINMSHLMHPHAGIDAANPQQADHGKRAEVAVGHQDIAGRKRIQQFAEQGRLPRFFAAIGADLQIQGTGGGQRDQRAGAGDGKPQARLLRAMLRIGGLIRRRVGHREGESIYELGVTTFPKPIFRSLLLGFLGNFHRQVAQRMFRKFGPRATIVTNVAGGHVSAALLLMQITRDTAAWHEASLPSRSTWPRNDHTIMAVE